MWVCICVCIYIYVCVCVYIYKYMSMCVCVLFIETTYNTQTPKDMFILSMFRCLTPFSRFVN